MTLDDALGDGQARAGAAAVLVAAVQPFEDPENDLQVLKSALHLFSTIMKFKSSCLQVLTSFMHAKPSHLQLL